MMNLKKLTLITITLFISACSMDSEQPVFIGSDGDYLDYSLKIDGMNDNGKPVKGFLKVHPSSDGSYYVAADVPPKYDDRYVFKAVKNTADGIVYAVQIDLAPRPNWNGGMTKRRYEVYPVRISAAGSVTVYEFLRNAKTTAMAKKRKVKLGPSTISLELEGNFDRQSAQCFVQDLINNKQYKLLNENKINNGKDPKFVSLTGYLAPKELGIADC